MQYYLSIFLRRIHWFLLVATVAGALAVTVAASLPPAYVSTVRLIFEAPQIPTELASSTVNAPASEQMQIIEQRLMTRANLLDIARRLQVLPEMDKMTPDDIVQAMRARTRISRSGGRNSASLMTIAFEAPSARNAAAVLNEYLTLIQRENTDYRLGRAGDTLEFFQQEVNRLQNELEIQSTRILEFKRANSDALPDSLNFRLGRQQSLEERRNQIDRDLATLKSERERMVQVFQETGRIVGANPSPQEQELAKHQKELDNALMVYAPGNPRIRVLQNRVTQIEAAILAQGGGDRQSLFDLQLAQLDAREQSLGEQRASVETQLAGLATSIEQTPLNAIALERLERDYRQIQSQYGSASDRLARASTGERIELLSRGQRISVIEQPSVPNAPTKPNRVMIAGAGSAAGIGLGLALIVLLELMNSAARRPVDLVNKLGLTPIATIPYIRTRGEVARKRALRITVALVILLGVPAAVVAVHFTYLPLDLLADRLMNRLGVRF
jgi:uncharacterized protein involved in exopolysaccharide biosynthesis